MLVGYVDFATVECSADGFAGLKGDKDEKEGNETTYISIKQAARENFFGKLVVRLQEEQLAEIQEQLGVADSEGTFL